jgi:hypothetical protein
LNWNHRGSIPQGGDLHKLADWAWRHRPGRKEWPGPALSMSDELVQIGAKCPGCSTRVC